MTFNKHVYKLILSSHKNIHTQLSTNQLKSKNYKYNIKWLTTNKCEHKPK